MSSLKQFFEKHHDLLILLPVIAAGLFFSLSILREDSQQPNSDSETWILVTTDEESTVSQQTVQTTAVLNHNLNLATEEDLQRVDGIGPVLAERIVEYRKTHGAFRRRAELLEISGISEALMEKILTEFEIPDEQPPETTVSTIPETTVTAKQTEKRPAKAPKATTAAEPAGYYDLNTVTKEQLTRIPGMSETMADQVLTLREQIHGFSSVYELNMLDGFSGKYIKQTCMQYLYVVNDPAVYGRATTPSTT